MNDDGLDPAARVRSFRNAGRGVWTMLRSQPNAWIHAAATLAVVVTAALLGVSRLEWLALALAIASVWMAEAFNTAIELLGDVASPGPHAGVGRAKDVAAGAVLLSAVASLIVGVLVLGPHLLAAIR